MNLFIHLIIAAGGLFAAQVHLSPCDVNTIRHKDHFIKRSSMLDLI